MLVKIIGLNGHKIQFLAYLIKLFKQNWTAITNQVRIWNPLVIRQINQTSWANQLMGLHSTITVHGSLSYLKYLCTNLSVFCLEDLFADAKLLQLISWWVYTKYVCTNWSVCCLEDSLYTLSKRVTGEKPLDKSPPVKS